MDYVEAVTNPVDEDRLVSVLSVIQNLTAISYVPVKLHGNTRPLEESDYNDFLSKVECNLSNINDELNKLLDMLRDDSVNFNTANRFGNDFVVPLVLLCGEHRKCDFWSSKNSVKIVDRILESLCKLCHCNKVGDILLGTSTVGKNKCGPLLKPCLLSLRPKLLKDTWKTFPAAVTCYQWILFQMKVPHLSDCLNLVLPTALIVVDDFQMANELCGIQCLQHIIENVTCAELGWYGQGDVIFQALQRVLYEREPALVRPLISCLVLLLNKLERCYLSKDNDYSWSRYDDVLEIVLRNVEMESRSQLRQAYMESLPCLLDPAGITVVRWSKRLLRIIKEYMEVAGQVEQETAAATLQALKTYITLAQPRLRHHATVIYSMVLRLLYDVTAATCAKNLDEKMPVVKLVEECLVMLAHAAPEETKEIAMDICKQARFNDVFAAVVDSVFTPFIS